MTRSSLKDFETVSRLGSGSFGTVFKVKRLVDEKYYVIKTVRIVELSYKEQTEAINEVQILAQLKSPYVVRYYDSFIEKDSLHIVMEFCNRGDLQNLIRKAKEKNVAGLKENVIWNIALQVMLGLQYLHRKHILHRDLKSANVFLMKDETKTHYLVKIGDLGVAKLMDTSTALASTIVGTPYYLSPELCMDMPYRDKSDCWAFGVLAYECCTLEHPFEARNQCALIMKIIEAHVKPPSASVISHELRNLILWLLQKDPELRPSIRDILCEEHVRKKMAEHKFDVPHELRDQPLRNILVEHDFENDENTKKKRSSIKMLAEKATSQQITASESTDAPSNGKGGTKVSGGIASIDNVEEESSKVKNPPFSDIGHRPSNVETSKWNSHGNSESKVEEHDEHERIPPRRDRGDADQPAPRLGSVGSSRRNLNGDDSAAPPVRGNRVRGPSFRGRVTSEAAMNRHQVQRGADSSTADSKIEARPMGSLMREASKKIEIDTEDNDATVVHTGPSYYKSGAAEVADSKDTSDHQYEEDFENYDTDENRERSPVRMARDQSAKGEEYDTFDEAEPLHHYSPSRQQHGSPAPMLGRANKTRQGSFKESEPDYIPPEQRSPSGDNFHETDSSLQLNATAGADADWDPVWTQRRGFINDAEQNRGDSLSPNNRPGSVSKAGAPLRRLESDTAEFAMGPPRDGNSPFAPAFTPIDRNRRDTEASLSMGAANQEDIDSLMDLIDDARSKAEVALGTSLFKKVYDLCSHHMNEPCRGEDLQQPPSTNIEGGEDGAGGGTNDVAVKREQAQPFIKELERLISENTNGGIEVACEAVFGVKLLLALESKYETIMKHAHDSR